MEVALRSCPYPDIRIEHDAFKFIEDAKKPNSDVICQRLRTIDKILRWEVPFFIPSEKENSIKCIKEIARDLYQLARENKNSQKMRIIKRRYRRIKAFSGSVPFLSSLLPETVQKILHFIPFIDILPVASVSISTYKVVTLNAVSRARVYHYKGNSFQGAKRHMKSLFDLSFHMDKRIVPKNLKLHPDPENIFSSLSYDHEMDSGLLVKKENILEFVRKGRFLALKKIVTEEEIPADLLQQAFQYAVSMKRDFEIIEMLIEAGADVNNLESLNDLNSEVAYLMIKLLLKHGWNPNTQNESGNTLLHLTMTNGFYSIAELLLENGADPNIQNIIGDTPLFYAIVAYLQTKPIKLLLDYGADPFIQNKANETFLSFVDASRSLNVYGLVLDHLSNLNQTNLT